MNKAAAAFWGIMALTPGLILTPGMAQAAEPAMLGLRDDVADRAIGLMLENPGPGQADALLGVFYLRGARLESDPVAAGAWLERAAAAGHPAGIYAAARIYAEGVGGTADPERARRLLTGADPARFGPLADNVRQLMIALNVALPAPPPPAVAPPSVIAPVTVAPVEPPAAEPPPVVTPAPEPPPTETTPTETQAPPPPPAPAPAVDSGGLAQLATLSSEASANGEVRRLKTRLPANLLGDRELTVESGQTAEGRAIWRVTVRGFADREAARRFCAGLTTAGFSCLPRGR